MRTCHQCGVCIKTEGDTCPLCGQETVPIDENFDRAFPHIKLNPLRSFLYRFFLFLTMVIGSMSVLVNIFIFSFKKPWSLIILAALVYAWSLYFYNIKRQKNRSESVLMQVLGICLLTFVIDFVTGFTKWSTTFVMPCVILLGNIAGAILIITKPLKIYEYMMHEVALLIIGAIPFGLYFLHLTTLLWTGIFCLAGSILVFITILLFCDHDAITELRRRVHY